MIQRIKDTYNKLSNGLKATVWYTFCNFAQKAINVLVIPIYTRLLSSAEYGTYSVFISWVELFEIIATFRLFYGAYTVGLVKYDTDRERYTSSLEKVSALITTCVLGVYLVFQQSINRLTGMSTYLTLLMFLMLYAVPIVGFWKALQRVDNYYRGILVVVLSISVFTPLCGVLFVLLIKASATSVIVSRVGVEVLVAAILLVLYRNYFFKKLDRGYCRYALSMSIPLIPFYLSTIVLNHSDRIIIQNLVGSSEAGIYSVAYSAAMIMTLFNTAFDSSLQPWLFKQLKKENYEDIPQLTTVSVIIVAVLNLMLIAFAPEVISFLAPAEYHEAIWIIPPLASSVFIMFFYQRFINVEFFFNESRITSIASIGAALLNVILNFLLIPVFGYLAAGYTTLFSYIVFWIMHFYYFYRICKKNSCPTAIMDMRALLLVAFAFFFMVLVLAVGYKYNLIRYVFLVAACAVGIYKRRDLVRVIEKMAIEKKAQS